MSIPGIYNIGKVLEYKLNEVGIDTYEKLCKAGTRKAFSKLYSKNNRISKGFLFAIDGAIQGIKTKDISSKRRVELLKFFKSLKEKNKN